MVALITPWNWPIHQNHRNSHPRTISGRYVYRKTQEGGTRIGLIIYPSP